MPQHTLQFSRRGFLALGAVGAVAALCPEPCSAAKNAASPPPGGTIAPTWRAAARAIANGAIGPVSHIHAACGPRPDAPEGPAEAALCDLLAAIMAAAGLARPQRVSLMGGSSPGTVSKAPEALLLTAVYPGNCTVNLACSPKGNRTPAATIRGSLGVVEIASDHAWLVMNDGTRRRLADGPGNTAGLETLPTALAAEVLAEAMDSWRARRAAGLMLA